MNYLHSRKNNSLRFFRLFILGYSIFAINIANAQLCQGSLGDPLVNITFGSGSNPGAALSAATTAYQYKNGDCPTDGFYTIATNTNACFNNTWHTLSQDHTGNANGYFMLINASIQPSAFYIDTVRGLCSNSTYEFATWVTNMLKQNSCGASAIQPNITFSIEKTDGTVIQTFNTGNIPATFNPQWNQFGFFFITPLGVNDVVLRMINNATGGCGNDLAIDDITFRPCGPTLTTSINGGSTATATHCEGIATSYNFNCTISAGLNTPTYQWQESINGNTYTDIPGQNTITLTKNFLANATNGIYKYRLNVAEVGNLNSASCRTSSSPITITITKKPTFTLTTGISICENATVQITANGNDTYTWTGPNNFINNGNIVTINNAQQINAGKYYATATNTSGCSAKDSIDIIIHPLPNASVGFADSLICEGKNITLLGNGIGAYQWIPNTFLNNAISQNPVATPTEETSYRFVVTTVFGCTDTAFVKIRVSKKVIVNAGDDKAITASNNVQLNGSIVGDWASFVWSPNDFITTINTIQPIVFPPSEKKYYLTAVAKNNCGISVDSVTVKIFDGIFIPNAFTPNGDGKNDTWDVPALKAYPLHTLIVYNRYGQKVFERKQNFTSWDGKYKGEKLTPGAYTYFIDLKNGSAILKGTLLLIR
jgi:gliding motility-associated-like protein